MILVGIQTLRYTNFITFSNVDMLFHISPFPNKEDRIFYGLKKMEGLILNIIIIQKLFFGI